MAKNALLLAVAVLFGVCRLVGGQTGLSYCVVDTNQSQCYNNTSPIAFPLPGEAFYGQDAQFSGAQPSYVDNADGTVTDLNTGLMWQKTPGNKLTHAEAVAGAATFQLAGHTDWRLPTIKDLYSLIDFSGVTGLTSATSAPYIDTGYFDFEYGDTNAGERHIDAQFWSSTEYVGTTMNGDATVFGVNFADGRIKGYPRDTIQGPGGPFTMTSFVRHVRGNPAYGVNDFVDNGDGTVTDRATGLMWQKAESATALNWEQALAYAESLSLAGYDDWRLPNAKELQSVIDYTRAPGVTGSAAIDPAFEVTNIGTVADPEYGYFWSGTSHLDGPPEVQGTFAVYVAFGRALGWMEAPPGSGNYTLLDVHGAGAQRSDPKTGDPADWPRGNGPQGDVVRIFNYVRCVRSAGSASRTSNFWTYYR